MTKTFENEGYEFAKKNIEITLTIYLNNERSEQFWKQNIFYLLLDVRIRSNTLEKSKCYLEQNIGMKKPLRVEIYKTCSCPLILWDVILA